MAKRLQTPMVISYRLAKRFFPAMKHQELGEFGLISCVTLQNEQ